MHDHGFTRREFVKWALAASAVTEFSRSFLPKLHAAIQEAVKEYPLIWNASPHDDRGTPRPIEQALIGASVKDPGNPFSLARIVRSFDPCIACAVHLVSPRRALLQTIPLTAWPCPGPAGA